MRILIVGGVAAGAGVILAAHNDLVSGDEFEQFLSDFSEAGLLVPMNEEQIDAASVISGCGPAYYYMFMDAMAKAGEQLGLSYETAATLAEATARGSAILAEGSSASLKDLRIAVCSPGGSTIEGVRSFQKDDLDECVRRALKAAYDRTLELANS
jgi:pyrroline-5-carboxylate reductase